MRIIIEEHQYPANVVEDVLDGITNLRDVEGKVSVNYVGYYYNPKLKDCVFILPKVLLEDVNGEEQVFGHCKPEEIIHLEAQNVLSQTEHEFIYELSVWIYRAVVLYHETHPKSDIVLKQNVQQMAKGRLRRKHNTFLDILLALQKFNRENQDFFFFILRNLHSGYNKINWTRTISHSAAFVQDGTPVYLNPVNRKRQINFDEELLIIFFSILHFINRHYGFPVMINVNFPLITGQQFENYRDGFGKTRLMQIKYKYFSDKALYLWELCYAFFDRSKKVNIDVNEREYLLVKNFNIVFEAIIDELVGGTNDSLPNELKDQPDGKRVDHLYQYHDLTNNEDEKPIYYIGDSKYYKRNTPIGKESVYKQFTYARNVIQWNMDLFNDGKPEDQKGHIRLNDETTEGYNIIPNFFISAEQKDLEIKDNIRLTDKSEKYFQSRHYENRLFDRDTFLVAHYDVNFLFVVALYGRNNPSEKEAWRNKVRKMFRKEIQTMLEEKFDFYVMTAKADVSAVAYIEEHFQELIGKVFTPYDDRGTQKYFSLALDRNDKFKDENEALIGQLGEYFHIEKCAIGDNPQKLLPKVEPLSKRMSVPNNFLTFHYLERYKDKEILLGCYHDQAHLDWILGKNDKGTLIYNLRLDKSRAGAQVKARLDKKEVCFVVLYGEGHEGENKIRVFRVHHHATMNEERMRRAWYPNPQGKYFCYVFDEEVTLGPLDVSSAVADWSKAHPTEESGTPIFLTGEALLKYRKT